MKNFYKILQVVTSAEPEVIKASYKALAFKYHPDRNKSSEASQRMEEINEAHSILNDPEKRKKHDIELARQSKNQAQTEPPEVGITKLQVLHNIRQSKLDGILFDIDFSLKNYSGTGFINALIRDINGNYLTNMNPSWQKYATSEHLLTSPMPFSSTTLTTQYFRAPLFLPYHLFYKGYFSYHTEIWILDNNLYALTWNRSIWFHVNNL